MDNDQRADEMLRCAELALALGRVERATYHEDGKRKETVTDHTVMLGLVCVQMALAVEGRGIRLQSMLLFALVHDLLETITGDVNTLVPSEGKMEAKATAEAEALRTFLDDERIPEEIRGLVLLYEKQEDPAARFVRYLDKLLPKLTHALNGGQAVADAGLSSAELKRRHMDQCVLLNMQYPEFADLLTPLYEATAKLSEQAYAQREGVK